MATATILPELKVSALRADVANHIRQALLEGRFQLGEALSETALASGRQAATGGSSRR